MLSCKDVSIQISRACDQRLSWRERLTVRMHLLVCEGCARLERQMAFLRTAARTMAANPDADGEGALSTQARRRIRRSLAGND